MVIRDHGGADHAFPALVTVGLDRPVHSGQPAQVQLLGQPDDFGSYNPPSSQDDAADLFKPAQTRPVIR
ncbi:MAG: hypothetical protein IPL59_17190 [Candidatus Competibacteraceae bacterium]|nr:hypothetical protein [Candidatus Competibacteraceae bacterium]